MALISLTAESVRREADPRSYERGRSYAAAGLVRRLTAAGTTVRATVDGSRPYRVTLEVTRTGIVGECTCPYGAEGVFCKHCVATALVWLQTDRPMSSESTAPEGPPGITADDLAAFLCRQDPAWLAEQLMKAAESQPLLRARLEVAAGADVRAAYDDSGLRDRLDRAIAVGYFVDYGGAHSYFRQIDEVLEDVEELIDEGFPATAIDLTEYALDLLEDAAGMVDDSDGGLRTAIGRAEQIHLAACREGEPDPIDLADRLATRALGSDWEVFLTALPDYVDVLGQNGMAHYRDIVETAWRALPPKQAGEHDHGHFTPTFLMERLAESAGGADALIEVIARDITSSYDILRIAERLVADGRDTDALTWLDRGMAEFESDPRLRSLAASCHVRAGRRAEALELLWANFANRPSVETYQRLHEAAGDGLPAWRERALSLLRQQPRAADGDSRFPFLEPAGHSTLVEVLLWEGDVDGAWEAAQTGGCRSQIRLRLARERGKDHPADAVPILKRAAEQAIEAKKRPAYQHAARLLGETRVLAERSGEAETFHAYVARLRQAHKPKRALQEELNRAGLPR